MRAGDVDAVEAIAARVHPGLPERRAVFEDRLTLAPHHCFVLVRDGRPAGYLLAHPWLDAAPPALDTVLGALPDRPAALCLHDLALLPEARGGGAATALVRAVLVRAVLARADAHAGAAVLVAVGGSAPFWERLGFAAKVPVVNVQDTGLGTYGPDAVMMRRAL